MSTLPESENSCPPVTPEAQAQPDYLPERPWLWLAALLSLSCAHFLSFTTLHDQAFVAFRIAEHWVQNGESLYNAGQPQPAAANFLWVALLAAGNKLTGVSVILLAQLLGSLCALLIPVLLFLGLRRLGEAKAAVPATALCVAAAAWAAWPLSGLEISLFSLLALAGAIAFLLHQKDTRVSWLFCSGLAFGLATLTRPEGGIFFVLSLIFLIVTQPRQFRAWVIFAVAYALVVPGMIYSNASYHWLHIGFHPHFGWEGIKNFFHTYQLLYLLPFLLPALANSQDAKITRYGLSLLGGWLLWSLLTGGEFFPYHPGLSPVWPLFCLLLGIGLARLGALGTRLPSLAEPWLPGAMQAVLTVFLALLVLLPSYAGVHHVRLQAWSRAEPDQALAGKWFAKNYLPAGLLAVKSPGVIPYYSGMQAIDFFGRLDRKPVPNVSGILDQHPRVVLLDERLYPADQLPEPGAGDGALELAWREDARHLAFRPIRAEIAPGRWLQYFEAKE